MPDVLKLPPSTFPGAKGNPGCLRSRACTPVNSSVLILAPHGASRYRSQMSVIGVIVLVPGGCQPIAYPVGRSPFLEAWPHDGGKSVQK